MILDNINSPKDLKKLTLEELPALAIELRKEILETVSRTGGHLASSLGAVELITALHYCLDAPNDKIIFDVGHQAYAHKILTGRRDKFSTLRQYQGVSGFQSKDESPFDPFTTGHSSSAISLALGVACARDHLPDEKSFKVVAVVGDGSLSGGLCFEGLNNAGHIKSDILVVLNTNELSISPNTGAISTYLNKLISLPIYNRFKDSLENFFKKRMPKGSRIIKLANKFEEGLKGLFVPGMLFEELGFRYFGPFDGHDLEALVPALKSILNIKGPRLMHVVTKKGRGYLPAENEPVRFHGIGPFDIESGKAVVKNNANAKSYTDVFGQKLALLAQNNEKILAVTAAMPEGTGLDSFRDLYPQRFFDVGIAEAHAACFSAGLARSGFKPVLAVYSTFLQRAYDQIIEDIALQGAGVLLAVDRAGIVGEDGATHQGIFDIAYLRNIPNMVLMAPKDAQELEQMLEFGLKLEGPAAIRYPRAVVPAVSGAVAKIELGKAQLLQKGEGFALFALGSMVEPALGAMEILKKAGLFGTLVNARFIKPLDSALFREVSLRAKCIFSAEEGIVSGGFGSALNEILDKPVEMIGLPCEFIPHGARDILLAKFGLTAEGIAARIKEALAKNG